MRKPQHGRGLILASYACVRRCSSAFGLMRRCRSRTLTVFSELLSQLPEIGEDDGSTPTLPLTARSTTFAGAASLRSSVTGYISLLI